MIKFSIKEMNVNFDPMQREVMLIKALSLLQFIIAVNLMPPAAFNLLQSLVASKAHNADVVVKFEKTYLAF